MKGPKVETCCKPELLQRKIPKTNIKEQEKKNYLVKELERNNLLKSIFPIF